MGGHQDTVLEEGQVIVAMGEAKALEAPGDPDGRGLI
jgi:hypothetical protein